ncbi:hypothetical protein BH23ACT9_BH23ACT9_37130 [soil metagenome]
MSTDDRQRVELFELLVPTVGREAAVKLLDALPPPGQPLATATQLAAVEQRMDDRFTAVDQRFTAVEQRMDDRFTAVEQRIDDRMNGLREELLAAFRGELVSAVSGQTRHVIVATATATFGIGGLAVTLAQLL